jgi:glycosyltransferase involved in cell wall biosynthesis
MTKTYLLSYVLTTRNKLPLLKEVMARLLAQRQPDEEIIVTDGASTDGTREYLAELHRAGPVDQFISEPDQGEAHGYNKGLLRARGELVKLLTDDDAFYYPGIQACKRFMQAHPQTDVLATNGAAANWASAEPFERFGAFYQAWYERWREEAEPFAFCGLGLMIRRASIPVVGILNPAFARVDMEFSLRVTAGLANLAWYTGDTWIRVTNPDGNSTTQVQRINAEGRWLELFYRVEPATDEQPPAGWAQRAVAKARGAKGRLARLVKTSRAVETKAESKTSSPYGDWPATFVACDDWLVEQNARNPGQFLFRDGKDVARPLEHMAARRADAVQRRWPQRP